MCIVVAFVGHGGAGADKLMRARGPLGDNVVVSGSWKEQQVGILDALKALKSLSDCYFSFELYTEKKPKKDQRL